MTYSILLLLLGLTILILGAEGFVNGASSLARKYHIPDLTIGLTIVAFGTSAPELVVNLFASANDLDDVVLGNVIGSSNFNLFVILGIAGLISPLVVESNTVRREIPLSIVSFILLALLANTFFLSDPDALGTWEASILLIVFCVFLFSVYQQLRNDQTKPDLEIKVYSMGRILLLLTLGLGGLILGGNLAVDHAVAIASDLGWSEKIIGLTVLAAGTSLPELATSVIAAIKGNNNIAVGNVIGSNLFNLFFILPVSIYIDDVAYGKGFNLEMTLLITGNIFLFVLLKYSKGHLIGRLPAAVLLIVFIVYTIYMIGLETGF